ncbi:MAG: TyeA family type III secretion system gatekeeper subunit [Pseudomonadota bacterium]
MTSVVAPQLVTSQATTLSTNTSSAAQSSFRGATVATAIVVTTNIANIAEEAGMSVQEQLGAHIIKNKNKPDSAALPQVRLADMTEELGFIAQQHRVRDLKETQITDKSRTSHQENNFEFSLEAMQAPRAELDDARLERIYRELLDSPIPDRQALLAFVAKRFSESAYQFIILLYCHNRVEQDRQAAQQSTDIGWLGRLSQLKTVLTTTIRWCEEHWNQQLRAAINISSVVRQYIGREEAQSQSLHQFYCDAVLDYVDLNSLYRMVLTRFGIDRFPWAVEFLKRSLAADYDAQGSSIAKEKLRAIIDDMYQLTVLETIHVQCWQLQNQISRLIASEWQTASALLAAILGLQTQEPSRARISDTLAALEFKKRIEAEKIALLNGIKHIVRLIPLKMYRDSELRNKLLKKIQEYLDELVSTEESLEEEKNQ